MAAGGERLRHLSRRSMSRRSMVVSERCRDCGGWITPEQSEESDGCNRKPQGHPLCTRFRGKRALGQRLLHTLSCK